MYSRDMGRGNSREGGGHLPLRRQVLGGSPLRCGKRAREAARDRSRGPAGCRVTALHHAAERGEAGVVAAVLGAAAPPSALLSALNAENQTALDCAVARAAACKRGAGGAGGAQGRAEWGEVAPLAALPRRAQRLPARRPRELHPGPSAARRLPKEIRPFERDPTFRKRSDSFERDPTHAVGIAPR